MTATLRPPSIPAPSAGPTPAAESPGQRPAPVILSFDVEEHHRIEAAAGLPLPPGLKEHYAARAGSTTRWLLDELAARDIKATFFVVGEFARQDPDLVLAIRRDGHEVASHGWDHRRILEMTPAEFREDLRRGRGTLEQITGEAVVGYRAPTFSIVRRTAWALDILAEEGLLYDSSIFPVRHDRYGIPQAPRLPFYACGPHREILEIPPATFRIGRFLLPIGGGGYFRLLPLGLLLHAVQQLRRDCDPGVAMLYFHPWEFDPDQHRLPLGRLSRLRTYVGITRSRDRLGRLLSRHAFARAIDVAHELGRRRQLLSSFRAAAPDRRPDGRTPARHDSPPFEPRSERDFHRGAEPLRALGGST